MDDFPEETKFNDGPMPCKCMSDECGWEGPIDDCGSSIENDGWEYPEYTIATCPKCGEAVEY